ncbi:MAG: EpsD family peptidyl-prolyl cis-trans isomerase [Chlorobiaceae bacterium]|nr:EpsD family peptidyl-prolyl cis-trans isomerase [Chlorobiaceae bacterium]
MKKYLFLVLVMIYTLAGCSNQTENSSGGSVAANVNGVEITKSQVNYLYERTAPQGISPIESANLKRNILAGLIRMELFAQKAKEMGLDKSSNYAMERYIVEKRALASLAENELVRKKMAVSDAEIQTLVENTPLLFAQRKLYIYEAVRMGALDKPMQQSLDAMINKGATLEQLTQELNAKKIPFARGFYTQAVDQIPGPVVNILNQIKPNAPQLVVFNDKNNTSKASMILMLHRVYPTPLTGEAAKRAARQMLVSYRQQSMMGQELRDLVDHSKITYFDEYLKSAAEDPSLTALPVPDTSRVAKETYKISILGGILFASLLLAVMVLSGGMTVLSDKLWLPRLWWKKKAAENPETEADKYAVRYVAPMPRRLYIYALFALVVVALLVDIRFMISPLPTLTMLAILAGGIVAGILTSRIFSIERIRQWSSKTYMVVITMMTVLILVGAFVAKFNKALFM